ncbi:MAG: hypothetical protein U1E21_07265 [Reyranellaceae bacterium]|jgi:hypothetical protein
MSLDPIVLNLVSTIVILASAGVSLLTWYYHRDAPGLRPWTIALLLATCALVLYGQRAEYTPGWLIFTADLLFVAGFAMMWMSLRRFNDRRIGPNRVMIEAAMVCAVFTVLSFTSWQLGGGRLLQSGLRTVFICLLSGAAAWETWRGGRQDGLQSRAVAASALAGIALIRAVRTVVVALQLSGMVDATVGRTVQNYTVYITTGCMLIVTFGLILMATERAERERAALFDRWHSETPPVR